MRSGFTLFELLVVMVILGLAAGLTFVSVSSGILKGKDARFREEVRTLLQRARAKALLSGEPVRVLIESEERRIEIEGGRGVEIPEEVQVEGEGVGEVSPGIYGILFYPDGSSSGGALFLRWPDGAEYSIRVGRIFGGVKMAKEAG